MPKPMCAAKETKIISTYASTDSIISVIQFYIIVLFVHIIVRSTLLRAGIIIAFGSH